MVFDDMTTCPDCEGTGETDYSTVYGHYEEEEYHEEQLNELFDTVKICGMEYEAGHALKLLDPMAFRCSMNDAEYKTTCPTCEGEGEIEPNDE